VNAVDYAVLLASMLGIALYGVWRTRGRQNFSTYLKGAGTTPWLVVGLSVMATQASAITFLSTPGQGYEDGLRFVQNYFGAPLALILISAVFLPIYRKLNVHTAYEFLGQRFDTKTRLLGAALFLLQRGFGAGITIYAPAIVLSSVLGWRLDLTILASGIVVTIYTAIGGSDAVTHTQKYQLAVAMAGMVAAFVILVLKLPSGVSFGDAMAVASGFHKLDAVDFSPDLHRRYTFWSGTIGAFFLMLSYFGTDQSQVQRYIGGGSLRECRLGLMFNAICKIPMQVFILLLGTMLFVFYQFERPPVLFSAPPAATQTLEPFEKEFAVAHVQRQQYIRQWLAARHAGDSEGVEQFHEKAASTDATISQIRARARAALPALKANENDYVFITFILHYLPHGLIGLLVAAFFAAALSSKAAELNALASTTTVDLYRHLVRTGASDEHYLAASKIFVVFWGAFAIAFALFVQMAENLIQAVNIVGSVFYGVILGIFLVAFFLKNVRGSAVFWAAIVSQALVFVLYYKLTISYLWYNLIGCAACMMIALLISAMLPAAQEDRA
jgi:solute:Na+ symporter, SSS family